MIQKFFSRFGRELAIDLGTSNTLIFARGEGLVLNEPSVIALNQVTGEVEAVGKAASAMLARTPSRVRTIQPLKDGVVANLTATEEMLLHFLRKIRRGPELFGTRALIGVANDATPVERRAIVHAAMRAGVGHVQLVPEPLAAAIGIGLPVAEPMGRMVVDIGSGCTDIAVISLSDIVVSETLRVAGARIDFAVMQYVRDRHHLLVGEPTAETIKIKIGSAVPFPSPRTIEVTGRDLVEGLPRTITLNDEEIRKAIKPTVDQIVHAVRKALDKVPPEVAADLVEQGIVVTGGGAKLAGLTERIAQETKVPVQAATDPLLSVVTGVSQMLEVAGRIETDPSLPWSLRPSES